MPPRFDKLLILDLDETLIHSRERIKGKDYEFHVGPYGVLLRPGATEFADQCTHMFTVGIWTTATIAYATEIVKFVFPNPYALSFIYPREKCTLHFDTQERRQYYVKDLAHLHKAKFTPADIIVVDDTPDVVRRNPDNAVLVKPYHGDPNDDELPALLRFLEFLGPAEDVRTIDKSDWRNQM